MKLASWNVNGVRSILRKGFRAFIDQHNPDVICLQEIKASREQMHALSEEFPSYTLQCACADRAGYSGVATLVRRPLLQHADSKAHDLACTRGEGRIIETRVQGIRIYNIYFPSGTTGDERQKVKYAFLDSLLSEFWRTPPSQTIVCGDFNICHREIDIHHPEIASKKGYSGFLPAERAWMDTFTKIGFVDSFRELNPESRAYTWWTFRAGARAKNLGWRIDYVFVSKDLRSRIVASNILEHVQGSDHCPITLELRDR